MKYKAVIFDLGDTLLTSFPSQRRIYASRLEYLGYKIDSETAVLVENAITNAANGQIAKETKGAPRMPDDVFECMLDIAALSCVDTRDRTEQLLKTLHALPLPRQELTVVQGAKSVLQALIRIGYRLGVVSNHKKWMMDYLKKEELAGYFETIVISEIVGIEKPDVRIMQIAMANLGLDAVDCVYVGDHPFDVLCAKSAGMDCVWLSSADAVLPADIPYSEDYRISRLEDLLAWL